MFRRDVSFREAVFSRHANFCGAAFDGNAGLCGVPQGRRVPRRRLRSASRITAD
ncbi:hypothetical protein AB0425_32340 [Actinosynnema sp. NPDC051121]